MLIILRSFNHYFIATFDLMTRSFPTKAKYYHAQYKNRRKYMFSIDVHIVKFPLLKSFY